jgi:hypothetical protein
VLTGKHFKGCQLILCFSDVVIGAEISLDLLDKFFPVVKPGWLLVETSGESEFKPLEGLPVEVGRKEGLQKI